MKETYPVAQPSKSTLASGTGLALLLALTGCIGAAAAAVPSASTPITQSEAKQGAEAHPQLLAEFGGAMTGPYASYVEQIGKNVAVQSGLGNAREDFTVSLLNSSVNNAFAIPGGYVYTTRQLVALMNNEAELAAVLGHEVGHVAARHSQRRQKTAQRNSILGVLGSIASNVLLGNNGLGGTLSNVFQQGSQLLTLKFSRKQELQADELGIRYLTKAGYDPQAMSTVLRSLALQNNLDAQLQGRDASIPAWASTHPDPASRVVAASQKAQGLPGTVTSRDSFLARIDGMLYGDDPEQGIIEGQDFIHPELKLRFTSPAGFYMINGTRAVSINGQSGQAQLTTASYSGDLDSYIRAAFTQLGGSQQKLAPASIQRTTVNGLRAAYGTARASNGSGQIDVTVFAYEFAQNQAFHFQTVTAAGKGAVFNQMYQSMRRISSSEAAAVVPRKIQVVTVARGDTVASLARRMAYDTAQVERFRVLNGLGSTDELRTGQKVKLVVRAR